MRKGQFISIDLILSVLIFVSVFVGFFYFISVFNERADNERLVTQGEGIPSLVQENISRLSFMEDNAINIQKITEFSQQDYRQLQKSLGIEGDFCIYFEDEEGNIIPINQKAGIGSNKVYLGENLESRCGLTMGSCTGISCPSTCTSSGVANIGACVAGGCTYTDTPCDAGMYCVDGACV